MKNLSNMKWEELLNELYSVINVLSKIENVEKQKKTKQFEVSSLYGQIDSINNYSTKVEKWFKYLIYIITIIAMPMYIWVIPYLIFGEDKFESALLNISDVQSLLKIIAIPYLIGFFLAQFFILKRKRKLLKNRKEEEKRLPNLNNQIVAVNNEINSLQRELDKLYKENNSLLQAVPSTYRNKVTLTNIYNILYNQRAYDWKNAVNIYESDLKQQKLLNQQKQFQEEQLKKAEEILKEQQRIREDNARYQESQLQLGREQADRVAAVESAINRLH